MSRLLLLRKLLSLQCLRCVQVRMQSLQLPLLLTLHLQQPLQLPAQIRRPVLSLTQRPMQRRLMQLRWRVGLPQLLVERRRQAVAARCLIRCWAEGKTRNKERTRARLKRRRKVRHWVETRILYRIKLQKPQKLVQRLWRHPPQLRRSICR